MGTFNDKKILNSWAKNVDPWISAIRENKIESRRLITNQAIIDSVMSLSGASVIDIGCGEGWLARELSSKGFDVLGIDAIPGLIEEATRSNMGKFRVLTYEDISKGKISDKFDIAVCNFSLFGKDSVANLFKSIPLLLNVRGYLIVQTIHPALNDDEYPYCDSWREESWGNFDGLFVESVPWYFRTFESWLKLFLNNNYQLIQVKETVHPETGKAASLIITGRVDN